MTASPQEPAVPSLPRVSVVMATCNYGQYIAQAVQSVVDQTCADWELIIVDDGSTDETPAVVAPFLADPRIHYHRQQNRGQPQAKNAAIRLSRAPLIAFLDADDAWLPEKLQKQLPLFDKDADLGVAYTARYIVDPANRILQQERRDMVRGHILHIALKRTIPPFSSAIVRRAVLDDVGLFDESIPLAIDYELWLRVASRYRFDFIDEPLLLYRTGHANLSRRSDERRRIVLETIMPRFLDEYGGRKRLSRRAIAEAYADTYTNSAESFRPQSMRKALSWHLRAMITAPWISEVWRSFLRTLAPEFLIRLRNTLSAHRPSAT